MLPWSTGLDIKLDIGSCKPGPRPRFRLGLCSQLRAYTADILSCCWCLGLPCASEMIRRDTQGSRFHASALFDGTPPANSSYAREKYLQVNISGPTTFRDMRLPPTSRVVQVVLPTYAQEYTRPAELRHEQLIM